MSLITLLTSRFEGFALLGGWFCIAVTRNMKWVWIAVVELSFGRSSRGRLEWLP
jgi:hypothetical protein